MFWKTKADIKLSWEWPDDRVPDHTLSIMLNSIKKKPTGLLGLDNHPSYLDSIPDGVVISGTIISGDATGKTIELTLPAEELANAKSGDTLVLGMTVDFTFPPDEIANTNFSTSPVPIVLESTVCINAVVEKNGG